MHVERVWPKVYPFLSASSGILVFPNVTNLAKATLQLKSLAVDPRDGVDVEYMPRPDAVCLGLAAARISAKTKD